MYKSFYTLSRLMALLGGLVLIALVVMVCVSILGGAVSYLFAADWMQNLLPGLSAWVDDRDWIGVIDGETEIVEAGLAFCACAFLPYCQITGGHAFVDLFTSKLSAGKNRVLTLFAETLFCITLWILAIQTFSGTLSKIKSGQTTFLLEHPIWWGYAGAVFGLSIAAVVSTYVAAVRLREVTTGRTIMPQGSGAEH